MKIILCDTGLNGRADMVAFHMDTHKKMMCINTYHTKKSIIKGWF